MYCFVQTASFSGFGSTGASLFGSQAKSTTGTGVFQTPGQTSAFGSGTSTGFGATGKFEHVSIWLHAYTGFSLSFKVDS